MLTACMAGLRAGHVPLRARPDLGGFLGVRGVQDLSAGCPAPVQDSEPGPSWAPITLDPIGLQAHSSESGISSPSKLSGRNVSSSASDMAIA